MPSAFLLGVSVSPTCSPGTIRVSQVLNISLHTCHALRGPRQTLRSLSFIGFFVLASGPLTPSPSALSSITGLYQDFRECGLPCGLRGSLCTLQLFRSVVDLLHNCNTRYGWLVRPYPAGTLTLQETPSLLGALTVLRMSRKPRLLASRRLDSSIRLLYRYPIIVAHVPSAPRRGVVIGCLHSCICTFGLCTSAVKDSLSKCLSPTRTAQGLMTLSAPHFPYSKIHKGLSTNCR